MRDSTRILVNTGILYVKAAVTIIVALFSTRFVLQALGKEDYGLYALVGGVFAFLGFLSSTLAGSSQRFLAYYRHDPIKMRNIFNTSLALHFAIGVLLAVCFEFAGCFLFDGFLNIDAYKVSTAQKLFHLMVGSTFVAVVSGPFEAVLISHENQAFSAAVGILDAVMKLMISLSIFWLPGESLLNYGMLIAIESLLVFCIKLVYCYHNYEETRMHWRWVCKNDFRSLLGFSMWTSLDTVTHIIRDQAITVLLNRFFGVSMNAANGISRQVNGQIAFFSNVVFQASSPQIIQHISRGEMSLAVEKALSVSKMAFLLMALFSVPLMVEMPRILDIWLVQVPEFTTEFCRLALVVTLVYMLGAGLNTLLEGVGRVGGYRSASSIYSVIVIFAAWLLLKSGMPATSVFWTVGVANTVLVVTMVGLTIKKTTLSLRQYLYAVPFRVLPVFGGACAITWWLPITDAWPELIIILSRALLAMFVFSGGSLLVLNEKERTRVFALLAKLFGKLKRI